MKNHLKRSIGKGKKQQLKKKEEDEISDETVKKIIETVIV